MADGSSSESLSKRTKAAVVLLSSVMIVVAIVLGVSFRRRSADHPLALAIGVLTSPD